MGIWKTVHACNAISVQIRLINISIAVCCGIMAGWARLGELHFLNQYKIFNNEANETLKVWNCAKNEKKMETTLWQELKRISL